MNKTYICRGGPVWPPVICSSKYMSIHINLWHLLVCSGAHTGAMVAGDNRLSPTAAAAETAPTGLCRNSQKINSFKNRVPWASPFFQQQLNPGLSKLGCCQPSEIIGICNRPWKRKGAPTDYNDDDKKFKNKISEIPIDISECSDIKSTGASVLTGLNEKCSKIKF